MKHEISKFDGPSPMTSFVEHKNCKLAYEITGEGPPVVFIQGVGVHGRGWMPQVEQLSKKFTCLIFDNRGLGQSQPIGCELTVPQMEEDTRAIMDHANIESAHLVGHSLGGLVAVCFALENPSRVLSLSLICTFADGRDAAPLTARMLWLGLASRVGTRRMRRHGFLRIIYPQADLQDVDVDRLALDLEPLFGHDLADQPPVVSHQLRAMRRYSAQSKLSSLSALRTLIVSAERDPIAPPMLGLRLNQGITESHFVTYPNASHGLPIQCASELNKLLLDHLEGG